MITPELDAWLRAQPDRCPLCGMHLIKQDHRPDCPIGVAATRGK